MRKFLQFALHPVRSARLALLGACRWLGKERALRIVRPVAWLSRKIAKDIHLFLLEVHWSPPTPEWQDQFTNMFGMWEVLGQAFLAERGVMSILAIPQDAVLLELCCGDGYYTRFFHAGRASSVTAVDFDPTVIAFARRYHQASNVTYMVRDIRTEIPEGSFDTIIWNGAIEHFTPAEIDAILRNLRARLKPGGILAGYTIAAISDEKQLCHHEYEFKSKEDLLRFFTPHFANTAVYESTWPAKAGPGGCIRHNLYFFASDGPLPLGQGCPATVRASTTKAPA